MSRKRRGERKECVWCHKDVPVRYLNETFEGLVCDKCLDSVSPKKRCSRCGKEKPRSAFGKRSNHDSLRSWCKVCHQEYSKEIRSHSGYRERNATYMREYRARKKS